jgi:hypothetical protein
MTATYNSDKLPLGKPAQLYNRIQGQYIKWDSGCFTTHAYGMNIRHDITTYEPVNKIVAQLYHISETTEN